MPELKAGKGVASGNRSPASPSSPVVQLDSDSEEAVPAPAVTPRRGAFRSGNARRGNISVNYKEGGEMEVDESPRAKIQDVRKERRRENSEGHNGFGVLENGGNGGQYGERQLEQLHTQFNNTHMQYNPRVSAEALQICLDKYDHSRAKDFVRKHLLEIVKACLATGVMDEATYQSVLNILTFACELIVKELGSVMYTLNPKLQP
ncbi:hypothetical protein T484DRAFT_3418723 [Baffinella frigidus]|nr:hypothetical protein T484DRAFT_3418723 [Cryptophyta sp. CCMP2293]